MYYSVICGLVCGVCVVGVVWVLFFMGGGVFLFFEYDLWFVVFVFVVVGGFLFICFWFMGVWFEGDLI